MKPRQRPIAIVFSENSTRVARAIVAVVLKWFVRRTQRWDGGAHLTRVKERVHQRTVRPGDLYPRGSSLPCGLTRSTTSNILCAFVSSLAHSLQLQLVLVYLAQQSRVNAAHLSPNVHRVSPRRFTAGAYLPHGFVYLPIIRSRPTCFPRHFFHPGIIPRDLRVVKKIRGKIFEQRSIRFSDYVRAV